MASAAEYATGGATVVASEEHEPVKAKAPSGLSRGNDEILDGGKPTKLDKNLAGSIESVQSSGGKTKLLIHYRVLLEMARRVARDPSFDPIKAGMTGVVNGTDLWFVVTQAAGGYAVAEIQGHHTVRSLQTVTVNPDDSTLSMMHSHRPKPQHHANEHEGLH